ncbi:MAG: hypothetical protein JW719_10155 [Pirellulales bacterium]|nr:hypothetical protein [Pirellulales bacterium]
MPNLILLASVSPSLRPRLSFLERRVLRLVALGHNRREISILLSQPAEVVRQCQANLKRKAKTTSLRGLAGWARRKGLSRPDDRLSQWERDQLGR